MRIALVTDTFSPQVNGVTTVLEGMVHGLRLAGHQVAMVAPRYPGHRRPTSGARELRIPSFAWPTYEEIRVSLPSLGTVTAFLDEFEPDVVHVATEGTLGLCGRRYALRKSVPLVTSFHTDFPRYCRDYGVGFLEPLVWRWLLWFHGAARLTHAPGAAVRDRLREGGITQATLWGRNIDIDHFHPRHRDPAFRARFGMDERAIVVLHVGRLAAEKNIDVLIDSWIEVRRSLGNRAAFVVAGEGPMSKVIMQRAPWVRRLGFVDRNTLAGVYANADVAVFPSASETCGLVALEAMASGLPVICANAGGFPDNVTHERTGLLVNPDDAKAFAAATVRLALERGLRQAFGENARDAMRGRGLRSEVQELIAQYAHVITTHAELECSIAW